jgi:hypothetical protein
MGEEGRGTVSTAVSTPRARRGLRGLSVLALVGLFSLLLAPLASADNVVNDVTVGDTDTFTAGGSTSIGYKIVGTGGDAQSGCNPADGSAATVTINTPSGVTPTPGSLTFTTCNDFQNVTFTSTSPGDYTITVSVSDSGTGSYSTSPATFTLHVLAPPTPSDTTPPDISYVLTPASPDGSNGWYVSDVTLTWTITENESPGSLVTTGCEDQNITADQDETTYSCSATSDGGSAGPVSVSIKRDATAPDVSLVGGPADGGSYYFGFVPDEPTCDASDATSGLDGSCSVSGYSNAVGSHTVTASATDNAGNEGSDSASYDVLAWTLSGFYSPVAMGENVVNTIRAGSTVPLKFEVFAGSTELTDVNVISFRAAQVDCGNLASSEETSVDFTTTGGTSLRYDTTSGQFVQNWQTPKNKVGSCYRVRMTTQDGSSIYADFKLK